MMAGSGRAAGAAVVVPALAERRGSAVLARVAERLAYFGVFQLAVALVMLLPVRLERLRPLEPMRFLHLVYLLFVLLSGDCWGNTYSSGTPALAAAVCAARRRDVLCAAARCIRNRASGVAGRGVA